jgi:hypothetical protein
MAKLYKNQNCCDNKEYHNACYKDKYCFDFKEYYDTHHDNYYPRCLNICHDFGKYFDRYEHHNDYSNCFYWLDGLRKFDGCYNTNHHNYQRCLRNCEYPTYYPISNRQPKLEKKSRCRRAK